MSLSRSVLSTGSHIKLNAWRQLSRALGRSEQEFFPNSNSQNMSVDLPSDVLHTIIEVLANDDPPDFETIQSISRTCRYLLPACRKHLFSAIWLQSRIYGSDVSNHAYGQGGKRESTRHIGVTNLAKIVARSPEIAGYIREFIFYPHPSNWVDETLLPLLQKFDRLEKLHIRHQRDKEPWNRFQDWSGLAGSLQIAMLELIHRQRHTLTHLYFTDYANIPITIIYPLTCLHTFHLLNSNISNYVKADSLVACHPCPLQLKSLAFSMSYNAIKALLEAVRPSTDLPFFDLSQLRIFSVTTSSTEMVDEGVPIGRLLQRMSQLKTLDISTKKHSIPLNLPDILNSTHPEASAKLEMLWFQVRYTPNHGHGPPQLPAAILHNTQPFPSLKHLGITVCISLPVTDNSPMIEDFIELDNLLSTQRFSTLKSLYLFLSFINTNGGDHDIKTWLNIPALMPWSSMNPALEFIFSP